MKPRLYKFTPWLIRLLIPKGFKGTYILYTKSKNTVVPIYVGRSDTDLQRRLLYHPYSQIADYFEYFTFDSAEKTYLSETALYHCFEGDIANKIHPAMPANTHLKCPFCNKTYNDTRSNRINLIS